MQVPTIEEHNDLKGLVEKLLKRIDALEACNKRLERKVDGVREKPQNRYSLAECAQFYFNRNGQHVSAEYMKQVFESWLLQDDFIEGVHYEVIVTSKTPTVYIMEGWLQKQPNYKEVNRLRKVG